MGLQAGAVLVLQFIDLAEVEDSAGLCLVGEVHGGGNGSAGLGVDDSDTYAVIAGGPFVFGSAFAHASAACVHVAVAGGIGGDGGGEQEGYGEQEDNKLFQNKLYSFLENMFWRFCVLFVSVFLLQAATGKSVWRHSGGFWHKRKLP